MLHRRAFLAGLLALPAIVHASNLMPLKGIKMVTQVRKRAWVPFLEADGSMSLVKGEDRYLDAWLKSQAPVQWGETTKVVNLKGDVLFKLKTPGLDEVAWRIEQDKVALAERVEHWKGFTEFQHREGVTVEATKTAPGERLRNDPPIIPIEQVKKLSYPCFQFFNGLDEQIVFPS